MGFQQARAVVSRCRELCNAERCIYAGCRDGLRIFSTTDIVCTMAAVIACVNGPFHYMAMNTQVYTNNYALKKRALC